MCRRRGVLNLDCALAVGHSARYAGEANGESYMELVVRCRATGAAHTHILKANHPDDARNWVRDLQARIRNRVHCLCKEESQCPGCVTPSVLVFSNGWWVLIFLCGLILSCSNCVV